MGSNGLEQKAEMEEKRIPRPPNAFMIFGQRHRRELAQQFPDLTNKQISKILGNEWRNMKPEDKDHFHKLAEEAYKNHMKMYPNYYYSPLEARQRKAERKRKFMMRCGRRSEQQMRSSGDQQMQLQREYSEQAIAIQGIPTPEGEPSFNDIKLIPVFCHHPIQSGNQTLVSFAFAPFDQFIGPIHIPMSEEEAAVRHMYGDMAFQPEPPTIYHVSHKDPNLGQMADGEQTQGICDVIPKQEPTEQVEPMVPMVNTFSEFVYNTFLPPMENSAISVTEVNQLNRETVIATVGNPQYKPKVIVKKEPIDDDNDNDPFLFSRVVDVLSVE